MIALIKDSRAAFNLYEIELIPVGGVVFDFGMQGFYIELTRKTVT